MATPEMFVTVGGSVRKIRLPNWTYRRSLREVAGESREDAARWCGVSTLTMAGWETGTEPAFRPAAARYRLYLEILEARSNEVMA